MWYPVPTDKWFLAFLYTCIIFICIWYAWQVASVILDSLWPYELQPARLLCEIPQERILEWVAIPSSRGSFWSRDWTWVPYASCLGKQALYTSTTWEAIYIYGKYLCVPSEEYQRRQWHPTPVLLSGKSRGRRSLVGGSPWGRTESDTTEWLPFHFSLSCIGEGNGNPLQCSCLENPRDRGAWWAAIYRVAQSWTQLKQLSSSSEEYMIQTIL